MNRRTHITFLFGLTSKNKTPRENPPKSNLTKYIEKVKITWNMEKLDANNIIRKLSPDFLRISFQADTGLCVNPRSYCSNVFLGCVKPLLNTEKSSFRYIKDDRTPDCFASIWICFIFYIESVSELKYLMCCECVYWLMARVFAKCVSCAVINPVKVRLDR